jgi:nitrite reductase/ring-hydroxylating ferredoxin subunit
MTTLHNICALEDIPDQKARGFTLGDGEKKIDFFIVRKGDEIFGYINSCPHTGINLDWQPDQFLDLTGHQIQCSTHGALFRIKDGYCVYGPCMGRSLTPVELVVDNGRIKFIREQ